MKGAATRGVAVCVVWSIVMTGSSRAWWESGHHVIAVLAFELMDEPARQEALTILAAHPRFAEDFTPPEGLDVSEHDRWRIGTAGYWPDIARQLDEFNRPTWHYQLGATLTIGTSADLNVPDPPGPLPDDASLQTQELYIVQAIALCRRVLADRNAPAPERALALCWIAHLVGDAHQPCHAGSLYAVNLFPEGDRGANSIPTRQTENLHALWDSLLGQTYDPADVRRRVASLREDEDLMRQAAAAAKRRRGLEPKRWLAESRRFGVAAVYTGEVLAAVTATSRGLTGELEPVDLSEEYLQRAGRIARIRAAHAAHRLASVWELTLEE